MDDVTAATNLIKMLCTCEPQPLGLPFVLTAGCLVHDRCVCHEVQHEHAEELVPGVRFAMWGPMFPEHVTVAEGSAPLECLWCASYVALLKVIGSLDEALRIRLQLAYLEARSR